MNKSCCCSKCGTPLPVETGKCCLCICNKLCVTVTGAPLLQLPSCEDAGTATGTDGICNCEEGKAAIDWDEDECAYIGTVECGSLSIDLRFDIKRCEAATSGTGTVSDSDCHLCLTSNCLNLQGACPDDCVLFEPGHCSGDCGDYLRDATQDGGFNATWIEDASGCGDPDCTQVTINAICAPRVNPAGAGLDRLCKDCDCVCDCISITYEEDDCLPQTMRACIEVIGTSSEINPIYSATFECPDGSGQQTISLQLERGEDGCCYWRLTASNGEVENPVVKSNCPEITYQWSISGIETGQGGSIAATVFIECDECEELKETHQFDCCTARELPEKLYVTIYDLGNCGCAFGTVIEMTLVEITNQFGFIGGRWRGSGPFCECTATFQLVCSAGGFGLSYKFWDDAVCGSESPLLPATPGSCDGNDEACCDPFIRTYMNHDASCCCDAQPPTPFASVCFTVTE